MADKEEKKETVRSSNSLSPAFSKLKETVKRRSSTQGKKAPRFRVEKKNSKGSPKRKHPTPTRMSSEKNLTENQVEQAVFCSDSGFNLPIEFNSTQSSENFFANAPSKLRIYSPQAIESEGEEQGQENHYPVSITPPISQSPDHPTEKSSLITSNSSPALQNERISFPQPPLSDRERSADSPSHSKGFSSRLLSSKAMIRKRLSQSRGFPTAFSSEFSPDLTESSSFASPSVPAISPTSCSSPLSDFPLSPSQSSSFKRGLARSDLLLPSSSTPDDLFCSLEYQFRKDEFDTIVRSLVEMPPQERSSFFISFGNSGISEYKLLETMKEFLSKNVADPTFPHRQKEEIVKIILLWRQTMISHYRVTDPLFACKIEELLDSLDMSFSHLLVRGGMSLFLCGSSVLVAQTMTTIMFQKFMKIQPGELLGGSWEKRDKFTRSPNVLGMTETFNRLSSMVVESILFCEENSRRQILVFMIKLAKQFFKINNFEGLAAVISGLNQSSIRRLKPLWTTLSSKYKKSFDEFDEMLDPDLNFKGYRNMLQTVEPPILPWMGPKLRELRYAYDGNQVETKDGLVNVHFLMTMGSSIRHFLQYQNCEYEFVNSGNKTILLRFLNFRSVPEEVCYTRSLSLFPQQNQISSQLSFGEIGIYVEQ